MNRFITFTFLLLIITNLTYSQKVTQLDGSGNLSLAPVFGTVTSKKIKPQAVGSYYWYEDYYSGNILLKEDNFLIKDKQFRYNIKNKQLEIKNGKHVIGIASFYVKRLEYINKLNQNRVFVDAEDYSQNNVPFRGFFELLVEDEYQLIKKITLVEEKFEDNYVAALDVGSKTNEIKRKEKFYISDENKEVFEVKNKKKANLGIFGDKSEDIGSYMKENKLKFSREEDLVKIVKYYNDLAK